jgi:hypothetical protein
MVQMRRSVDQVLPNRLIAMVTSAALLVWFHIANTSEASGQYLTLIHSEILDLASHAGGFSNDMKAAAHSTSVDAKSPFDMVDCDKLLVDVHSGQSPIRDPNEGKVYARYTVTDPGFYFSAHNEKYDKIRYEIIGNGNYYETVLTETFASILRASAPNARVVDVGANSGWFSLLSASLGHHVDAFEAKKGIGTGRKSGSRRLGKMAKHQCLVPYTCCQFRRQDD